MSSEVSDNTLTFGVRESRPWRWQNVAGLIVGGIALITGSVLFYNASSTAPPNVGIWAAATSGILLTVGWFAWRQRQVLRRQRVVVDFDGQRLVFEYFGWRQGLGALPRERERQVVAFGDVKAYLTTGQRSGRQLHFGTADARVTIYSYFNDFNRLEALCEELFRPIGAGTLPRQLLIERTMLYGPIIVGLGPVIALLF